MTPVSSRALSPVTLTHRPMVSAISLLLLASVLGVVLFITLRSPLKDDIAWLLYVARRWMAGRELYIDVVEVNPPLIVWISAVPLEIARWLNVDTQFVAMPVFIAGVLGCAWWTASLLRARGGIFAEPLPVFAAIGIRPADPARGRSGTAGASAGRRLPALSGAVCRLSRRQTGALDG